MTNPPFDNITILEDLFPLRSCVVTLRLLSQSNPGFLHHVALHAWVRYLAGSPDGFSDSLIIEPLENGHAHYQKGDLYRFRVVALNGGETILADLIEKLQQLPDSVTVQRARQHFGKNLELHSLVDTFEHQEVTSLYQLTRFDLDALALETGIWERKTDFRIKFLTPARLVRHTAEEPDCSAGSDQQLAQAYRKDATHKRRSERRYCRDRSHLSWPLITKRISDTLINILHKRTGIRYARPDWPDATLHETLAFWLHHEYSANTNGHKKQAGGMLMTTDVHLTAMMPRWMFAMLVLGQYTGIGQNRSFGMGQYQLQSLHGEFSYPRPMAAQALLQKTFTDDALSDAFYDMQDRRENEDSDLLSGEEQAREDEIDQARLQAARDRIINGGYKPSTLMPVSIDKPDGGVRLLSVPTWQDRTLQRAACNLLAPTLDPLWMEHSYGYRRGYSRLNAKEQINKLVQQGYHWILESDVESFFDRVNWDNLHQRLRLLLPNEPLVSLLMAWVKADRRGQDGETEKRTRGLPQGAPISPLLANLLLDDLDRDMLSHDYKMVRYADDFVLLFKQKEHAEAALPKVQRSLQEHGLDINADKTRVVSSSQGFRYLGYLFIDGYAIEISRAHRQAEKEFSEDFPVLRQQERAQLSIGERENLGTVLIVAGDQAMLFSEKKRLVVEQYEKKVSYPWRSLSSVLLVGHHQITTPALKAALLHRVPIHFASGFGQYQGVSASAEPSALGSEFWLIQSQYLQQQSNALEIARALVSARLAGQKKLIQRRNPDYAGLNKLGRLGDQIARCDSLDSLRGYEGQASKILWAFFKTHLDKQWGFTERNRRPPKDPVNAMLSLGYSFMYSLSDSIIRTVGLYPWQGAYHQRHGNHRTLASDLMEPYRYIVERVVLTLINRDQIKPDDFAVTEKGCQMSSEARKTLLNEVLVQLTSHRAAQESLLNSIRHQAWSLAMSCRTGQRFIPWRP